MEITLGSNDFSKIIIKLIRFSLPLIFSGILQQLYNWVDAFIVGNAEGELALGAIGSTSTIISFYLLMIIGFTMGLAVLFGQKYGAEEYGSLSGALSAFAMILCAVCAGAAILGIGLAEPFLRLLHTTPETIGQAVVYLKIVLLGVPFLAVYNVYSAALRGIGDSKAPFYSILVSSVMNVILDVLFVLVLRKGVAGVATATVISQITMTIFIIAYTERKHCILHFSPRRRSFDPRMLSQGLRFGIPPMIQAAVTAAGNLLLQNFMNGFGTATVIAITTSYRVDTIALLPISNLGSAISTLTAQGYGAGDKERVRKIRHAGLLVMTLTAAVLTALVVPFGSRIVALFGAGAEAVAISSRFFLGLASFYIIFAWSAAIRGYLEGIGDVLFSSIIGIVTLTTRVVSSYACPHYFGNMIIAYAEAFSWCLGLLLFLMRMRKKIRENEKTVSR